MRHVFNYPILRYGCVGVCLAWILAVAFSRNQPFTANTLEALFTGLAFAAVIATLAHEREKADADDKEHRELLRMMERQGSALEAQAKLEAQRCFLSALVARIEGYTVQFGIYGEPGKIPKQLRDEQNRLLHELHRELNKWRKDVGAEEITEEWVAKWQRDRYR